MIEVQTSQRSEFRNQKSELRAREPDQIASWCLWGKSPIRFLGWLAAVGAAMCLVAGCVGAGRVAPASSLARLEPEQTVELTSSAAGICRDGDSLLVLENSGTRMVRYGFRDSASGTVPMRVQSPPALAVLDTLPLIERVTAPAGVAADRFYIYVYDDHRLYRMSKDKLNLQAWLNNVRVAGLAVFEPGIVLVSDADRGAVWYKGLFGESRMFISAAEIARPGAMAALGDGTFVVLSAASKLVYFFNRSGVVTRSITLPAACDLLADDGQGTLCIGLRGRPEVWLLKGNRLTGYALPDSVSPLSMAVVHDRLLILDAGTKLSVYRIAE